MELKDDVLFVAEEVKFYPGGLNLDEHKDELVATINEFISAAAINHKTGRDITFEQLKRAVSRGTNKFLNNWRKQNGSSL